MGSVNSQGVYEYDVTDNEIGPVLLNRQSAALTNLFTGRANTVRVANVSQRAAALADHGAPSTSNPLIVFRADAGAGRELEYTTNGTLWHTVDANEPEDTGWVNIPTASYVQGNVRARRVGDLVNLQFAGTMTISANTTTNLASIPEPFLPEVSQAVSLIWGGTGTAEYSSLTSGGALVVRRPTAGTSTPLTASVTFLAG